MPPDQPVMVAVPTVSGVRLSMQPFASPAPWTVILGAPVYWYGPPGAMKNYIDRSHAFYANRKAVRSTARFGVISIAADSGFSSHEAIMTSWLGYYGLPVVATVRLLGRETGDVMANAEALGKLEGFFEAFER